MQKPAEGGGGRRPGREAKSGHPRDRTGRGANKRRTGVESGAGHIKKRERVYFI